MRATEKAERKIEMFLSGPAVKGNVAVSSMIRTNSLTDTFLDSRPPPANVWLRFPLGRFPRFQAASDQDTLLHASSNSSKAGICKFRC